MIFGVYVAWLLFVGSHYFLTIVDDPIRDSWAYLMNDQSEISALLKAFVAMIKN